MGFERGIWLEGAHDRDADVKGGLPVGSGAIGEARLIREATCWVGPRGGWWARVDSLPA